MFQVVYEFTQTEAAQEPLWVEAPAIAGEIKVSPLSARRRANGYLTTDVAMAMRPGDPVLIWGKRPMWRMPVYLHLPDWGPVALLGSIEVDAFTREVCPLSPEQITTMQKKAASIATHLTSETTPAS